MAKAGQEPRKAKLYVWPFEAEPPRPISSEGEWGALAVSPDGQWVAAASATSGLVLYPSGGGAARSVPGGEEGDQPRRWSPDGRWLYVQRPDPQPARVDRIDVLTGERRLWKEIMPADPTGVLGVVGVIPTPDGRGYAYSYRSQLLSLYLAEGLR